MRLIKRIPMTFRRATLTAAFLTGTVLTASPALAKTVGFDDSASPRKSGTMTVWSAASEPFVRQSGEYGERCFDLTCLRVGQCPRVPRIRTRIVPEP
jgi:hypothetical protein